MAQQLHSHALATNYSTLATGAEFCHCKHHSHFLQEMYILVIIILLPLFFLRATPPAAFVLDPWMRCQIDRLIEERCAMTFISDRTNDVRTGGEKAAKKVPLTYIEKFKFTNIPSLSTVTFTLTHTCRPLEAFLSHSHTLIWLLIKQPIGNDLKSSS